LCRRNIESENFSAVSVIQFGAVKITADSSFAAGLPVIVNHCSTVMIYRAGGVAGNQLF
jgi:hypothetical protein